MTTTYGVYAPALYGRRHDSHADARAARLGRSLLRWTVYSRSDHGSVCAVERVSRHWTRRAAIQAAARLTEETTR
jgi:hypothetical protein